MVTLLFCLLKFPLDIYGRIGYIILVLSMYQCTNVPMYQNKRGEI